MKKTVMMLMFAIVGSIGIARAQSPKVVISDKTGWHKIGETTVNFQKDRDEISVMVADRFAAIKFKVDDAPIDLSSVEVYYESGDKQVLTVDSHIRMAGESERMNLNGGERTVKRIVFVYKTLPNYKDKKAHVEIWGLKTNTDRS